MKRDIVHQLLKKGGRADIKDLKKSQQQMFIDSELYPEAL